MKAILVFTLLLLSQCFAIDVVISDGHYGYFTVVKDNVVESKYQKSPGPKIAFDFSSPFLGSPGIAMSQDVSAYSIVSQTPDVANDPELTWDPAYPKFGGRNGPQLFSFCRVKGTATYQVQITSSSGKKVTFYFSQECVPLPNVVLFPPMSTADAGGLGPFFDYSIFGEFNNVYLNYPVNYWRVWKSFKGQLQFGQNTTVSDKSFSYWLINNDTVPIKFEMEVYTFNNDEGEYGGIVPSLPEIGWLGVNQMLPFTVSVTSKCQSYHSPTDRVVAAIGIHFPNHPKNTPPLYLFETFTCSQLS